MMTAPPNALNSIRNWPAETTGCILFENHHVQLRTATGSHPPRPRRRQCEDERLELTENQRSLFLEWLWVGEAEQVELRDAVQGAGAELLGSGAGLKKPVRSLQSDGSYHLTKSHAKSCTMCDTSSPHFSLSLSPLALGEGPKSAHGDPLRLWRDAPTWRCFNRKKKMRVVGVAEPDPPAA